MTKYARTLAVVTSSVVACATLAPVAGAQQDTSAETAAGTCPAVQMIAVNDVADSSLESIDAGFLADVSAPVIAAANTEDIAADDLDAGFAAPIPTTTHQSLAENDDWRPDVWGDSAQTSPSTDWRPDVWGDTQQTAPTPVDDKQVETPARQPNDASQTPTTAPAAMSTSDDVAVPVVGRTTISVPSSNDTRAYIPGVTGPDTVPAYEESIAQAIADTESVLGQINEQCPTTKVVLLGVGQGAQAASAVSKKIGAGEVFPADKVLGVSLFADPTRAEDQPVVANGASAPAGASTDWDVAPAEGAGVAVVTDQAGAGAGQDYGAVADRTVSWCAEGDTSCALPEGSPLRTLVANTSAGTEGKAPEYQLRHVTDILAPAVLLGSVETLAEDVQFGPGGFSFARAQSADETLIGRVAAESDREIPQSEMQQRLLASGMKIGGMALAAGSTVVKEMIQPANLAQIAAATAVSPAAGVGAALLVGANAASELVNVRTFTTGAVRLADEAQALGIDDAGFTQAAVQAAVGQGVGKSTGSYEQVGMTAAGDSAATATTGWLLEIVGNEIGRSLGDSQPVAPAQFDAGAIAGVLEAL